ncbi:MAG TPA: uracil-DNA glycosylase [Bacteroidales bacterium]|nr:uracil-DNA glycosylase [Bacteroidales bacterium]
MEQTIEDINNQIKHCSHCRLHATRINAVCGEGPVPSKIMVIAQAPGRTEDKKGKMFIGPSGKVFDKLIYSAGLKREKIYITNLLKCFLPNCRKPRPDEMSICFNKYLQKEIEMVKPEIIVTLGYHVTKFIFAQNELKVPNRIEFKSTFGQLFTAKNRKIIPLRHPATVVHNSTNLKKLSDEYAILKTIQSKCRYFNQCMIPEKYKNGLVPKGLLDKFCYGNWKHCNRYIAYSKGLQANEFVLPE